MFERKRLFLPASLVAAGVVFGANSWIAWKSVQRLQTKYRFESLEGRLPERRPTTVELSAALQRRLTLHESSLDNAWSGRSEALKELHEETVCVFISRPNFGVARMSGMLDRSLARDRRESAPVPQPEVRSSSAGSWEEVGKARLTDDDLSTMHDAGLRDFLDPVGFGYRKDHQRVAGFQEHQFRAAPLAAPRWRLQSLDLVGLVVHPKPVAYVSENLPRMDELRKAPIRELNAFEAAGLKALHDGDDLFVREMPEGGVRMLGAVRALKQCLDCHGGARGDLLGAFSYELRRDESK